MRVVTFYSYKGGVGRTLACANFGLYLAKTGKRVVLADMDFEAPGLDSKFPGLDLGQCETGLLDAFWRFQTDGTRLVPTGLSVPLSEDVSQGGGGLAVIPAGNHATTGYYERLSALKWDNFTRNPEGMAFCLELIENIQEHYKADVLVIDSRTGLTEVGGLCTQALPDTVLLFTSTSPESLRGTARIHNTIANSPIVKSRPEGRRNVEAKIVVTRIPRPEEELLSDIEPKLKERLGLDVERLYFLFTQQDLSWEEYLALDRFGQEGVEILDDYVELFSSLDPGITGPYIQKRLEAFRARINSRSKAENIRIIEELVTLYPTPEALLEAAGFYRNASSSKEAIRYYLRSFRAREPDAEALAGFAEACQDASLFLMSRQRGEVARYLEAFGIERMSPSLLATYAEILEDPVDLEAFAGRLEETLATHPRSEKLRKTYFTVLERLGDWEKIAETATPDDLHNRRYGLIVAEAYARTGHSEEAREFVMRLKGRQRMLLDSPQDLRRLLRTLFALDPKSENLEEVDDELAALLARQDPFFVLGYHSESQPVDPPGFREWLRRITKN